jgi:alkaline phosphatase D
MDYRKHSKNMKFALRVAIVFLNIILAIAVKGNDFVSASLLSRIAFGSCLNSDQPQPIWDAAVAAQPQIFLLLGDTIGANATNLTDQTASYAGLAAQPGYQQLLRTCPIWATWNDRDDGPDFHRSQHPGVYDARIFGPPGKQVQIISLDVRTFRSPLKKRAERLPGEGPWEANSDGSVTLLGSDQWTWLRRMLRMPAQFRILVSSIQVVAEDHHWEKWMNLPHERKLLFDMISDTEADGILFISGDRRHAELSMIRTGAPYPLYDLTSGPLNMRVDEPVVEINSHGISDVFRNSNFGLITIDWSAPDPVIMLEIRDEKGATRIQHKITLSALQAAGHGP